jgi:hypothetical protein
VSTFRCALLGAALLVTVAGCSDSPTSSGGSWVPVRDLVVLPIVGGSPPDAEMIWSGPDGTFFLAWRVQDSRDAEVFLRVAHLEADGVPLLSFDLPHGLLAMNSREIALARTESQRIDVYGQDGTLLRTIPFPVSEATPYFDPRLMALGEDGRIALYDPVFPRIAVIAPGGTLEAGWGEYGTDPGEFLSLADLVFAPDGTLYLLDAGFWKLFQFSTQGDLLGSSEIVRSVPAWRELYGGVVVASDGTAIVWDGSFEPGRLNIFPPGATTATLVDLEAGVALWDRRGFTLATDGSLVLLDQDGGLRRHGPDGRFLNAIGHIQGTEPGESFSMTDMFADGAGGAWLYFREIYLGPPGTIPGRLDHLDASGTIVSSRALDELDSPSSVVILQDGAVVALDSPLGGGDAMVTVFEPGGAVRFEFTPLPGDIARIAEGFGGQLLVARREPGVRRGGPAAEQRNVIDIVSSTGGHLKTVEVPIARDATGFPYSIVDLHVTSRGRIFAIDSQGTVYEFDRSRTYRGIFLDSVHPNIPLRPSSPNVPIRRAGRLWSDEAGFLYVLDADAGTMHVLTPEGTIIGKFGEEDLGGTSDPLPFDPPTFVAVNPDGSVWMRRFDRSALVRYAR